MPSCTICSHTTATFGIEDSKTRKTQWYCYVCYMETTELRNKATQVGAGKKRKDV